MFEIDVSIEGEKIIGKMTVDSYFFDKSQYNYAFYLYNNGEKSKVVWYSNKMQAIFDLGDRTGVVYIRVFIKDLRDKSVRSYDSDKISISK